ncbi:MAG: hypothetical protein QOD14_575 [Solirubrobacterales bacterium]|nr:hypothetical protein [Solirubrobacterales bacterium]
MSGFASTGIADRRVDTGRGRTPRNGAGSIATDATERPRPAIICVNAPPKEWPTIAGFRSRRPITSAVCSVICPTDFLAKTSGFALASATVSGSSGQPGVTVAYPASSKILAQRSQLLGSSQSPWMKTTGVLPEPFA